MTETKKTKPASGETDGKRKWDLDARKTYEAGCAEDRREKLFLSRKPKGMARFADNGFGREADLRKNVVIEMSQGVINDVHGLPKGWTYEIVDFDDLDGNDDEEIRERGWHVIREQGCLCDPDDGTLATHEPGCRFAPKEA